jgi:hypothetical protein
MESYKIYYMGEGGDFPWVWAVVNLVSLKLHVAYPNTKGAPESVLTNLWLVECRFEWIIKSLSLFLVHPGALAHPSTPSSAENWERARTPANSVVQPI